MVGHSPVAVAEHFLWSAKVHSQSLTPMQVLKLVYIAHGWNLGLYSEPLINQSAEAWQYGPVIPSVYHEYKKFGGGAVTVCPDVEPGEFTLRQRDLLAKVWKGYGHISGVGLSSLTHQPGTPWYVTMQRSGRGAVIPDDLIEEHYRQLYRERAESARAPLTAQA